MNTFTELTGNLLEAIGGLALILVAIWAWCEAVSFTKRISGHWKFWTESANTHRNKIGQLESRVSFLEAQESERMNVENKKSRAK